MSEVINLLIQVSSFSTTRPDFCLGGEHEGRFGGFPRELFVSLLSASLVGDISRVHRIVPQMDGVGFPR